MSEPEISVRLVRISGDKCGLLHAGSRQLGIELAERMVGEYRVAAERMRK